MLSRAWGRDRANNLNNNSISTRCAVQHLRIGVEKHVFENRPYSDLANLFITLPLIELQITRIPSVEYYTLGMLVDGAPVMHGCEQLLAEVPTLKLRMNPQQRQDMH